MHLSRELAMKEMLEVIEILQLWVSELREPRVMRDGDVFPFYSDGVPPMLSVSEIKTICVSQFRAELNIAAAKLEAIAIQ